MYFLAAIYAPILVFWVSRIPYIKFIDSLDLLESYLHYYYVSMNYESNRCVTFFLGTKYPSGLTRYDGKKFVYDYFTGSGFPIATNWILFPVTPLAVAVRFISSAT